MEAGAGAGPAGRTLGIGSLGCAAGMIVATVLGSLTAGTALGVASIPLAFVAVALSAGAIVLGVVAAVRGPGRVLGIVGAVLGLVLDPILLALVLPVGAP